jgi:hypothetical protein
MPSLYIFNQYYIDFLKRIKNVAKQNKDENSNAKAILKTIKEHYMTFDKTSNEYLDYINDAISNDVWDSYLDNTQEWLQKNGEIELFKDIKLQTIVSLLNDDYLCNHFISVFYIFRNDLDDEVNAKIVKILQSIDGKDLIDELEDEKIKKVLQNLQDMRKEKIKEKAGIDMNFIEDTTLGKLAKEILEDIDVGKLQKSMGENGDVLKAIGDPDSGFADIISNVSKKMATKISNGELKQDNLIQDAMKFASMMPNLFGNDQNKSSSKAPDLSNIMNMMSSMMGDKDGDFNSILKNMKDINKSSGIHKGTKRTVNESALKKLAKAKKLKKKLYEKKKAAAQEADNTKQEAATNDKDNE